MTSEQDAVVRLEEVLLGGPRKYTRTEVAELSGVPSDAGQRIWRALGFPDVADDDRFFTDGDVEALKMLRELQDMGVVDLELAVTNARALAREMAALADWQVGVFVERFLKENEDFLDSAIDIVPTVMDHIVPVVEKLVVFVWRRQLASAGGRLLASASTERVDVTLAVGFADLVGYTRLVRGLDEVELDRLLENFEARASDIVAAAGGRIVKTIGDEVMFVADDVATAVEIGLSISETLHAEDGRDVRVGVAWGTVLSRLGDYYGTTVNLASRLTSLARPGTVLVDPDAAVRLADSDTIFIKPLPRMRISGFGFVGGFVARRRRLHS